MNRKMVQLRYYLKETKINIAIVKSYIIFLSFVTFVTNTFN